jgi:hypothetical protein
MSNEMFLAKLEKHAYATLMRMQSVSPLAYRRMRLHTDASPHAYAPACDLRLLVNEAFSY